MGVDHQWEMFRRLQQGPFSKGWIAGPKWKSWTDIVPKFVFQEGVSYFQFPDPRGWGQNGRKWAGCGNGQLYIYIILYILYIYILYYILYIYYIIYIYISGLDTSMATQTWTVKTVVSCIRLTVRISSARHGVDVSPPLRLLVPNPDTVRFSYIMERGTGSGLLLKMFCGTPVALRFCFLMQKHVHSWWYRHQLKIGRCSRVCPVMEGSFRGIAQNGLRDPTFFLFLGPQVFFLCLQDRMMTTQNSVFLTGNSGVGKAGVGWFHHVQYPTAILRNPRAPMISPGWSIRWIPK